MDYGFTSGRLDYGALLHFRPLPTTSIACVAGGSRTLLAYHQYRDPHLVAHRIDGFTPYQVAD
jgi:hypothetical protein